MLDFTAKGPKQKKVMVFGLELRQQRAKISNQPLDSLGATWCKLVLSNTTWCHWANVDVSLVKFGGI